MAPWVKVLATKCGFDPWTHMIEKENLLLKIVL